MLKILLSNDDGFDAPGLKVLYETLEGFADLFVVAPAINSSGAGCSITTNSPMQVTEHSNGFVSVTGKPADCVYLGIHESRVSHHVEHNDSWHDGQPRFDVK